MFRVRSSTLRLLMQACGNNVSRMLAEVWRPSVARRARISKSAGALGACSTWSTWIPCFPRRSASLRCPNGACSGYGTTSTRDPCLLSRPTTQRHARASRGRRQRRRVTEGRGGTTVTTRTHCCAQGVLKRADDGPLVGKPSSQISSSKIVRFDVYSGVLT